MSVSPSDIWFFDDTVENIEAAKSAGMQAFHVDRAHGRNPGFANPQPIAITLQN